MELIIEEKLGIRGRMISGSKSGYRNAHPRHLVVFNSNLIIDGKKAWYGDIDITIQRNTLREIAVDLEKDIYILYEMDGRFEHESSPNLSRFVYRANADGTEEIGGTIAPYLEVGEKIQLVEQQS